MDSFGVSSFLITSELTLAYSAACSKRFTASASCGDLSICELPDPCECARIAVVEASAACFCDDRNGIVFNADSSRPIPTGKPPEVLGKRRWNERCTRVLHFKPTFEMAFVGVVLFGSSVKAPLLHSKLLCFLAIHRCIVTIF